MMTEVEKIKGQISKLQNRGEAAMSPSVKLQVEAQREFTLAILEGALQTALLTETIVFIMGRLEARLTGDGLGEVYCNRRDEQ